jgi:hypothetical protein
LLHCDIKKAALAKVRPKVPTVTVEVTCMIINKLSRYLDIEICRKKKQIEGVL